VAINNGKRMAIFLIIVLSIYFLANLYLYIKGARAIKGAGYETSLYKIIFIVLASTFVAGKFLEYIHTSVLTDILNIIGGFWMAFMLYTLLMWLLSDIILLAEKPFHLIPDQVMSVLKFRLFIGITSITVILIIIGFIIAVSPVVNRYDINIDKRFADNQNEVRIVAVSDIHLGSIIRKRSMRHLSAMIKEEKPDLVLFLGDVIDGSIAPVLRGDLLSHLSLPDLRLGHYAITGNHEYIGDLNKTVPYIESKGIVVLKDEVIRLNNGVQIIGRLDRSANQGLGNDRADLKSLLAETDSLLPIILLDHQPFELGKLKGSGVDLQLSGHTHDGQMWPLNLITRSMFEVSHGYGRFDKSQVIVSSGFGIWGPRVRIGTRAEIVVINLKGKS